LEEPSDDEDETCQGKEQLQLSASCGMKETERFEHSDDTNKTKSSDSLNERVSEILSNQVTTNGIEEKGSDRECVNNRIEFKEIREIS
jgi:hypothetical protein